MAWFKIDNFTGLDHSSSPNQIERGALVEAVDVGFERRGNIQPARNDVEVMPGSHTATLHQGLQKSFNPDIGRDMLFFKREYGSPSAPHIYAYDIEADEYVRLFETADADGLFSVFSYGGWVWIYDGSSSHKWDGTWAAGVATGLYDIDGGYSLGTPDVTIDHREGKIYGMWPVPDPSHPAGPPWFMSVRDWSMTPALQTTDLRLPFNLVDTFASAPAWQSIDAHPLDQAGEQWGNSWTQHTGPPPYPFKPEDQRLHPVYANTEGTLETSSTATLVTGDPFSFAQGTTYYVQPGGGGTTCYEFEALESFTVNSATDSFGRTPSAYVDDNVFRHYFVRLDGRLYPGAGGLTDGIEVANWEGGQAPFELDPALRGIYDISCMVNRHTTNTYMYVAETLPSYTGNWSAGAGQLLPHGGTFYYATRYVVRVYDDDLGEVRPVYTGPLTRHYSSGTDPFIVEAGDVVRIVWDQVSIDDLYFEVYRSADGGGPNDLYLLERLEANGTGELVFYDSVTDVDLGDLIDTSTTDFVGPPSGSTVATFAAGKAFVAVGDELWWSYPTQPDRFSNLFQTQLDGNITGIVEWHGDVVIFTGNRVYIYSAIDEYGKIEESGSHVGTIYTSSVHSMKNAIYFVRDDGLYVFNGSSSKNIADKFWDLWVAMFDGLSAGDNVWITHDGTKLFVFGSEYSVPHSSAQANGIKGDFSIPGVPHWGAVRVEDSNSIMSIRGAADGAEYGPLVLGSGIFGTTVKGVENSRVSTEKLCTAKTGEIDLYRTLRLVSVRLSYSSNNTSGLDMTVDVWQQQGRVVSQTISLPYTAGERVSDRVQLPMGMVGDRAQFGFSGKNFEVDLLEYEVK